MKEVDMSFLQAYVRDYAADPHEWPEDVQREAVAKLYARDERESAHPTWIIDALVEGLAVNPDGASRLIDYLREPMTLDRLTGIGSLVEHALRKFPLDTMMDVIAERYWQWKAERSGDVYDRLHEERQARELEGAP